MKYKEETAIKLYSKRLKRVYFESKILTVRNGYITINPPLEWDGCSPKFIINLPVWLIAFLGVFGIKLPNSVLIGTPDLWIYLASAFHDVIYIVKPKGVSRKVADLIFRDMIISEGLIHFKNELKYRNDKNIFRVLYNSLRTITVLSLIYFIANIYYLAVRFFGWLWWGNVVK